MSSQFVIHLKDRLKYNLIALFNIITPAFVYKYWKEQWEKNASIYYSQEGEDILLHRLFEGQQKGCYVDIGAHHPTRFSNTYLFYKKGWKGINVDAMPGSMALFNKLRPNDINIEVAVSDIEQTLTYYEFDEPAINTFSERQAEKILANNVYHLIGKHTIQTITVEKILTEYLPENQVIDFMSIDVEGLDFNVLKSNNWNKFQPKVVLVEALEEDLNSILKSELVNYMKENMYNLMGKTKNTLFFTHNSTL